MADPEVRQDMTEELQLLDTLLVQDFINANDENLDPRGRQRMYVRRSGEMAAVENDYWDKDFQPVEANDKLRWSQNINAEPTQRGMPIVPGTLIERQQRLRNQLLNEQWGQDIANINVTSEVDDMRVCNKY